MNKKTNITIVAVTILVILAVGYIYLSPEPKKEKEVTLAIATQTPTATLTPTPVPTETTFEPAFAPEGWKTYSNEEWGVAFAYPPDWDFREINHPRGSSELYGFRLEGGGYEVRIGKAGGGLPDKEWTHPEYVIDGNIAKTWQADYGEGYQLIIVVNNSDNILRAVSFRIETPDKNTGSLDKFLSTVKFY